MTEKEKMLSGEWHDANFDETLLSERRSAELFCYDFNMSKPGSTEQITALKDLLSTELPDGLTVLAPVYFDYGTYTHFGRGTFVNHNCYFMDGGTIHIGENVSVMQGVTIGSGCVIAAGSVVTKDIPENCLVAGVPATIKKRINQ